jgi:hypothetical protein
MTIPLGRLSPSASRDRPGRRSGNRSACLSAGVPPLFGLAPGGVCHAVCVAADAVRSYRTLSPLLRLRPFGLRRDMLAASKRLSPRGRGGLLSVALSLGSPPAAVSRHRASVEPGLSSKGKPPAVIRPSDAKGRCAHAGASSRGLTPISPPAARPAIPPALGASAKRCAA